ncbi:hypothetical protein ATO6_18760 [Oceanicola sp. 22II-s10i]|uniref:hypothetical protein n=1 Tax=Oceanicola sp. 22II-s10i TaxID=1317116 RepID=UPI000B51F546|nr:hypothetical protein [Oceanicola sp. 22II-s10i]OWU83479.1 hypothetical protein ATO6_18760 [Oceanicola sp. 22II-s10i]
MEIVPSSVLALLAVAMMTVKGPYRGLWIFIATTPFGAAAAFNMPALGGASILAADLAAVSIFALVALLPGGLRQIAGSMRVGQPGFWLLLLSVFCVVATLFFPRLFQGQTEVFSLTRDIGRHGIIEVPLRPSTGNLTQLFRLMLGVATFYALATVFRMRPDARMVVHAVAVATVINIALGWIDVLSHAVGLPDLLTILRSANYSMLDGAYMAGLKRMVGGFPEASSYGYYGLGLFAFWLQYWLSGPRSRWVTALMVLSAVAVVRSTSSASYVALIAYLVTVAMFGIWRNLNGRIERRALAIGMTAALAAWGVLLLFLATYATVQPVRQFFDDVLFNKMSSSSGIERMSWNAQAFKNFVDTYAMGAGLGAVRASSWLMATLASIGVIGTFLFGMFILSVMTGPAGRGARREPPSAAVRASRSACLAFLISALLTGATPDMGVIFFAFCGLAAGLNRGAILSRRNGAELPYSGHAALRNNRLSNAALSPALDLK